MHYVFNSNMAFPKARIFCENLTDLKENPRSDNNNRFANQKSLCDKKMIPFSMLKPSGNGCSYSLVGQHKLFFYNFKFAFEKVSEIDKIFQNEIDVITVTIENIINKLNKAEPDKNHIEAKNVERRIKNHIDVKRQQHDTCNEKVYSTIITQYNIHLKCFKVNFGCFNDVPETLKHSCKYC